MGGVEWRRGEISKMMEMDGHETKLVTMADRATQTDEPYEPTMEMEHKQKKPRGRKRKSLEDATINMDPSAPRMDGIDFKHIDQLSSPKRKRLREEKIKPIEELKFADIKSYNRNQLRAYCSIYGRRHLSSRIQTHNSVLIYPWIYPPLAV